MPVFSFDKVNRIIAVKAPDTEVTVQQLINAIRDWEDELINMDTPKIADASGKESLGGGLQVGITLKLLNWKVKFEDRLGPDWVDCGVSGGNIVAVDQYGQDTNPIAPSSYVTVTKATAVSAALIEDVAEWNQAEKTQIFDSVGTIQDKTDNLPTDPAAQALVEAHITSEVDDLITRAKGLDNVYDSIALRALEATLKAVKDEIKARASFKV